MSEDYSDEDDYDEVETMKDELPREDTSPLLLQDSTNSTPLSPLSITSDTESLVWDADNFETEPSLAHNDDNISPLLEEVEQKLQGLHISSSPKEVNKQFTIEMADIEMYVTIRSEVKK
ncbi:hypothetical protein HOLleu_01214 [Holothuria leucospilota]|uniref:Uncharacterized protein n=1 Tax=Holothuria leucospilota TaxID=206669 RepID=A0A9Q1CN57_HOLLE|nr:hypothetical protein HOLleu_01214 [Holothuria leucospilota]